MRNISGAVICLNEQDLIQNCIYQLKDWVSDIVVVDGGSADGTLHILDHLKHELKGQLKIINFPFRVRNHFGDQKNLAISLTKEPWVIVLDADEELEPGLETELRAIAKDDNEYDAVAIPRRNFLDGSPTEVYPDYQVRFFRSYCRYLYPVHEELIGWRKLYNAKHHIIHSKSRDRFNLQQENYKRIYKQMEHKYRLPHERDW